MAYLSLNPVSTGVATLLTVSGLTDLVSTRIYDDVPQAAVFPFVWYEVRELNDVRGFGTGGFPEVELRVHAFSSSDDYNGLAQLHGITAKAIELLRDQFLELSGYTQAGRIFYDDTSQPLNEIISGVKCREMVARFRIYAEESDAVLPTSWVQQGWLQ